MVAIILDAVPDENRNLTIHLPDNMSAERYEVTIRSIDALPTPEQPLTRETARARLLATGRLSTAWDETDDGYIPSTDAERWMLGQKVQNARTAQDYINEERGEY